MLIARRTTPLVLALTVDPSGATRRIHPGVRGGRGSDASGYALLPVDDDGVVRRFDERIEFGGSTVPTLAGQMARRLGNDVIPHGLIDYAAGRRFDYVPLHDVLAWHAAGDTQKLEAAFGGKAVLLGGVFRFEDRLATPVNLLGWDAQAVNAPGVVLHAQALRNLLNDGLIAPVPRWVVPALCLLMAMGWWVARPLRVRGSALLAGSAAVLVASTFLLRHGVYLPPAAILLTLYAAIGSRVLYQASLQLRERRRLRLAFGAYVSPRILQDILQSDPPPGFGRRALPALRAVRRHSWIHRAQRNDCPGSRDRAPQSLFLGGHGEHPRRGRHARQVHRRRRHGLLRRAAAARRSRPARVSRGARHARARRPPQRRARARRAKRRSPSASACTWAMRSSATWARPRGTTTRRSATPSTSRPAWKGSPRKSAIRWYAPPQSSRRSRTAPDLLSWAPRRSRGTSRSRFTAGVRTTVATARRTT